MQSLAEPSQRNCWSRPLRTLTVVALSLCAAVTSAQAVTLNWSAVKEPGVGGAVTSIEVCPTDSSKVVVGGDMLGAAYSTDGGASWNDSFGLTNWECGDSTWKPGSTSEAWLGTMGGPFKSVDGGKNWVSKRSGMPAPETYWGYNVPIQKVVFDPNNSSRLLAFGGSRRNWSNGKASTAKYGAVWESTNGGESWTQKAVIADGGSGVGGDVMTAMFASGSSTVVYAVLRNNGVYRSNDGGATWTAKNSGLPTLTSDFIAVHPTDGNTLWWSGNGKRAVYKSTNGGDSWTFSGNGLSFDTNYDHTYCSIAVVPSSPNTLYVSNYSWNEMFKSTDGGANWTSILSNTNNPSAPTGLGPQSYWIHVDKSNPNNVFTLNSVTIYKSSDAGATWTNASSKVGSSTGLWQGRGYSGYVSIKAKWNPFNTNQCVLQGMDDGKFMSSVDNLTNWQMHGSTMNQWSGGTDVTFGSTNGSTIYVALGQYGSDGEAPARSTDGGATWTYLTNPGSGTSQSIYTLPNDTSKVWLIRGGRLYYSSNSGGAWSEINVDSNTNLEQIVGDNAATPNIYIAARNGAYKGSASNSFTKVVNISYSDSMKIALDPSKSGRFYLASYRYDQYNCGVYRHDNGVTTRISTEINVKDVAVDPQNANRVVYITDLDPGVEVSPASGVWMTENALDANPTWTQNNNGLPMLRGKTIAFHPTNGTIIVGLNGRGFYKSSTGSTPTPTPTPSGLAAPTLNSATAGDGQVSLSWTAVSGATGYRVKRSTTSGSGYSWVVSGWGSTSYTDTGRTNGTTYYYVISAIDSSNESANSNEKSATPGAGAAPVGTGTGLTGQYYNGVSLTSLVKTQTDAQVNFDWGTGQPQSGGANMSGIGADNFSVRWSGQVQAMEAGTYTFTVTADDGVRLTLNGATSPQIDQWILQGPTSYSTTYTLTAGQKIDLKMEYFEQTGGATAKLLWTRPGGTSVAIPQTQLYTTTPASTLLSQGKSAVTSSTESATSTADKAFDGDSGTRWASASSDPQWIYVDLGSAKTITQIKLNWETACGKDYVLQTSADGATGLNTDTPWTTIQTVTGNTTAGVLTYNVSGSGRYVRMKSTARATPWGNSLWEMQVSGY